MPPQTIVEDGNNQEHEKGKVELPYQCNKHETKHNMNCDGDNIDLVGAYQVYCQPLFAFIEKWASQKWPNNQFITKETKIPIPVFRPYSLNLFRLVWRTSFVISTTVISMLLPLFNDIVGILGALGFWPLTVYFLIEIEMNVGTSQSTSKFHNIVEVGPDEKTLLASRVQSDVYSYWLKSLAHLIHFERDIQGLLKHHSMLSSCKDGINNNAQHEEINIRDGADLSQQVTPAIYFLERLSSKLRKIALEYDLLASSSIDMGYKSLKVIFLPSHCSLLAFCIGFAKFVPNSPIWENLKSYHSKDSGYYLHVVVLHNLVGWLRHIEPEICLWLISLLKADRVHEASFYSQPRFQISNIGCESGNILTARRIAVKAIIDLQNDCIGVHGEDLLSCIFKNGTQLLLNMTKEWMSIPFQTPKYFFKVRPAVGALLFSSIAGLKNSNELVVLPGSHLSSNLCLQLENVPADLASQLKKIYCILYCKTSYSTRRLHGEPTEGVLMDHETWKTNTMIYLHERLQWYITELSGKSMKHGNISSDGKVIDACICFDKWYYPKVLNLPA
ncbi:hypothetical protein Ancab_028065 [Ancistrocladus abbreviatus]